MRIALFVTCLGDTLYPSVGRSTVRLLERLGHEVVFPAGQTCCGQMHINTGYQKEAVALIRHHVEVFSPYDLIVVPSASCVGAIRHQHAMVARRAGQPSLAAAAEAVAGRTYELSELLRQIMSQQTLDDRNRAAFFKSVSTLKAGTYTIRFTDKSSTAGLVLQKLKHSATVSVSGAAFIGSQTKSLPLSAGTWFFMPRVGKATYAVTFK